ncbi:MAG: hypothetical protein ACP5GJ_04090 [Nanopusillaceae archaeon]
MASYELEVITPILGGLNKEVFSFRVFAKMDMKDFKILEHKIVLTEEDIAKYKDLFEKMDRDSALKEVYKIKKKELEKPLLDDGYIKIDYLFPRKHADIGKIKTYEDYLSWIDWWSYFIRPLRYAVKYDGGADFILTDVKPENISLMLYANYNSKTKSPVILEAITDGSRFLIEAQSDLNEEITIKIGRGRNLGYGVCKLRPVNNKR